jgi:thiol-disulfide isomerase/thioredoxin
VKKFLSYAIPFAILAGWYYFRYHVAPEIDEETIQVYNEQGVLVPVSSLQNGPVLLNFYAAWCGHCMQEMEVLERAHQRKQFTVIGLTDDEPGKIDQVRARFNLTFPIYQLQHPIKYYDVHSLPTSYLLNADGQVVQSLIGPKDWDSDAFMNKVASWLSKEGS